MFYPTEYIKLGHYHRRDNYWVEVGFNPVKAHSCIVAIRTYFVRSLIHSFNGKERKRKAADFLRTFTFDFCKQSSQNLQSHQFQVLVNSIKCYINAVSIIQKFPWRSNRYGIIGCRRDIASAERAATPMTRRDSERAP